MNGKYIPLYRKYRPQRLEEIVGQEHIKKALANAIEMNKISHAYLFTGPRGTGKTSTARIFAKSLNCENGPTINPCGECTNCVDITNSVPMDVIEIDAASNRKVEDAQNILEKVMYAPVNSRYKIYIIDEVHMLSNTAFNALLKTLEEPPANVIFILATTEVHKVLDTIKSRCQRFDFRRITTDDIVKHLRKISDEEKINITDDALYTIAKNSAGGMRDSIALLDQLSILGGKEAITTDDINNLLGRISFDKLKALTEAIINSNPQEAIDIIEKIYNSGNEPAQILSNLLDYFKNLLIVKNCKPETITELTQLNEKQSADLSEQVKNIETHQISALIDKIANYVKEVKLTNNPKLWLEVGIIDIANLTENTTLADLQNRLSKLESGVAPVSSAQTFQHAAPPPISEKAKKFKEQLIEQKQNAEKNIQQKTEIQSTQQIPKVENSKPTDNVKQENTLTEDFSPMPKSKPTDTNDIASLWGLVLANVSSAPTRALLKQWANPVKISAEETIISLKNEMLLNQFVSGKKKEILSNAIDTLFEQTNSNVIVRLPLPDDSQVKAPVAQPKQIKKVAEPTVKQTLADENNLTEEDVTDATKEAIQHKEEVSAKAKSHAIGHSDQVNMVIDLFDGKIIE